MSDAQRRCIVVLGGGGHARVVISLIRKLPDLQLLGYIDPRPGPALLGAPYLGGDDELPRLLAEHSGCGAALGIGNTAISSLRLQIAERLLKQGFALPPLVSPVATVNEGVELGAGTVVCDGAIVATGTQVGVACILNTGCVVDHDCRVGDGVHIAPRAVLSGGVELGELSMVGTGAVVIQSRKIAAGCFVAAGATVTRDLPESGLYAGTPARRMQGTRQ